MTDLVHYAWEQHRHAMFVIGLFGLLFLFSKVFPSINSHDHAEAELRRMRAKEENAE